MRLFLEKLAIVDLNTYFSIINYDKHYTMITLSIFESELAAFLDFNIVDGTQELTGRQKANGELTFSLSDEGKTRELETVLCSAGRLFELLIKTEIVTPNESMTEAQALAAAKVIKEWALAQA